MSVVVKTGQGYVTSYREAWKQGDRPVWSWRTDAGDPPLDFGTVEAAQAWIDDVWQGETAKVRDEAGWSVETLVTA